MENWLVVLFGVSLLILLPWIPKLLLLRIRFFRWIRWEWAAKNLEDHFQGWSWFVRVVFFVIAVGLIYFGWIG